MRSERSEIFIPSSGQAIFWLIAGADISQKASQSFHKKYKITTRTYEYRGFHLLIYKCSFGFLPGKSQWEYIQDKIIAWLQK